MKNSFFTTNNQRMAARCVPLKAHHCVGLLRQQVNDLALALITPLGAEYDDIATHDAVSLSVTH